MRARCAAVTSCCSSWGRSRPALARGDPEQHTKALLEGGAEARKVFEDPEHLDAREMARRHPDRLLVPGDLAIVRSREIAHEGRSDRERTLGLEERVEICCHPAMLRLAALLALEEVHREEVRDRLAQQGDEVDPGELVPDADWPAVVAGQEPDALVAEVIAQHRVPQDVQGQAREVGGSIGTARAHVKEVAATARERPVEGRPQGHPDRGASALGHVQKDRTSPDRPPQPALTPAAAIRVPESRDLPPRGNPLSMLDPA